VIEHILWVIGGLVLLYFGAEWLVKGASDIALKLGVSPLVVGLTVVAFGTSAPELLVCLEANGDNKGGMALGNIIGSNICNIALVLGFAALIRPLTVTKQIVSREMPILIIATFVFLAMLLGIGNSAGLTQWEGGILVIGILTYVITSFLKAKKDGCEESDEFSSEDVESAKKAGAGKMVLSVLLIVAGSVALYFGSGWLVDHGAQLAEKIGIEPAVVALILIAFGTSVPELATSVVAARKGQGDIIFGNAIGSCIFNILAVMGITSLVKAVPFEGVEMFNIWVMLGVTIGILPFLLSRMKLTKVEGGVLFTAYIGYCGVLFAMEKGLLSF